MAFLNYTSRNLNLTTDDNLIAVEVYVAYREQLSDEAYVERVNEFQENNIEYDQLADWPAVKCQ